MYNALVKLNITRKKSFTYSEKSPKKNKPS
jgi:hypothetical protein